jgi:co-chaperonin GroES (HSP10)
VLQPIKNKILIQLKDMEKEEVLDSGIILTTKDRDAAQLANVLAVGPDVEFVKVGDSILPNWNSAEETRYEKEKYFLIKEDEVVMIVDDNTENENA